MEGPPLGPGGEDITWPDQVAFRGRKASSTRKIKPQTSNLKPLLNQFPSLLLGGDFNCLIHPALDSQGLLTDNHRP